MDVGTMFGSDGKKIELFRATKNRTENCEELCSSTSWSGTTPRRSKSPGSRNKLYEYAIPISLSELKFITGRSFLIESLYFAESLQYIFHVLHPFISISSGMSQFRFNGWPFVFEDACRIGRLKKDVAGACSVTFLFVQYPQIQLLIYNTSLMI